MTQTDHDAATADLDGVPFQAYYCSEACAKLASDRWKAAHEGGA